MSWGLVLSGGGACGIANVGVLEVLDGAGLRPDCIAGSSMGAIVAGVYALGNPVSCLGSLLAGLDLPGVARLSDAPLRGGLHGGILSQKLEHHLGPLVGDATIGDCAIPFVCVAGRVREPIRWERAPFRGFTEHVLERVEPWVFPPETRIVDAVMASSAVPVIFSPVVVAGEQFIDLLHFGAIPVRTLRSVHAPDVVVATDTMPEYGTLAPFLPAGILDLMQAGYAEADVSRRAADLLIEPVQAADPARFDRGAEFVAAGRAAATAALPAVERLVRPGPGA